MFQKLILRIVFGPKRTCLPIFDEHGCAKRCQFFCCHQLADEGMALWIQAPRLGGITKQMWKQLVVLSHSGADVLVPQRRGVAVQFHRPTVEKGESKRSVFIITPKLTLPKGT